MISLKEALAIHSTIDMATSVPSLEKIRDWLSEREIPMKRHYQDLIAR